MKKTFLALAAIILFAGASFAENQVGSYEPKISLFQSVEIIKDFLSSRAKYDYADSYLHSVSHHFSEGNPRKGACWLYSFAFKTPRMGGNISIYHFMDGEIVEFHHGP